MCDLLVSAFLLYALVEWLGDDAIDYTSAAVLAFIGTIIVLAAQTFLVKQFGSQSIFLGYALAGFTVSGLLFVKYGVEVKRAFLIGGLFVVGSLLWRYGLTAMF